SPGPDPAIGGGTPGAAAAIAPAAALPRARAPASIGAPAPDRRKIIYETQSTHKLLAAFSQASMIHVKGDINEETFNEAYMMHTT
ncbi:hypothetical protein MJH54_33790, partial [Salmonella enterica subsp. enterica serovar Montevideo]|nr:hypothetical protein [Salmonella enterica subsp. enterica serovar Montevideo]